MLGRRLAKPRDAGLVRRLATLRRKEPRLAKPGDA